ncbi:hypothetical protein RC62_1918 [Flavobacterium aquidurense]|uniref:Uncharacterized protein n=1 Tax=Flavobacterium aquidurense TaxID=362413 RepID=A0A0Q1BDQ7_9FLAO|nr:hypothetical protein RC62_1918 [Flavobacterium aquidurense]
MLVVAGLLPKDRDAQPDKATSFSLTKNTNKKICFYPHFHEVNPLNPRSIITFSESPSLTKKAFKFFNIFS